MNESIRNRLNTVLEALGTFHSWEADESNSDVVYLPGSFANNDYFIRLGKITEFCYDLIFPSLGWSEAHPGNLCIELQNNVTWGILVKTLEAMLKEGK